LLKVIAILGVIKSCTCSYTRTLRFLIHRSCPCLDSLGKFDFRAKSGFKHKCRARAGFGLQNEAYLQLCVKHKCSRWFTVKHALGCNSEAKKV